MTFVFDKSQFETLRSSFRILAAAKKLTSADIVLFNLIRDKDLSHGFTAITNSIKLTHGQDPWLGFNSAYSTAGWMLRKKQTIFGLPITEDLSKVLLDRLKG